MIVFYIIKLITKVFDIMEKNYDVNFDFMLKNVFVEIFYRTIYL